MIVWSAALTVFVVIYEITVLCYMVIIRAGTD